MDPATRTSRYAVSTSYELHAKLAKYHPELTVAKSTLEGWFSFPGRGNAAKYPEPLPNFTESMRLGYNAAERRGGRKPCLPGAEASLQKFAIELRAMRDAGVSLNSSSVRALLVSALEEDGHANLLSPHLLDPDGAQCELYWMWKTMQHACALIYAITSDHVSVTLSTCVQLLERLAHAARATMRQLRPLCVCACDVDKTKLCCSDFWLRCFFHHRLHFSWRVGTKAAQKLPDNWEELVDEALQRIAAMTMKHNIPPARVFMADETFLFYRPESKCAPGGSCVCVRIVSDIACNTASCAPTATMRQHTPLSSAS